MGKKRSSTLWLAGVAIGYVVLITVVYMYIVWPWNLIVSGLIVMKAMIFLGVLVQAGRVSKGRRPPSAPHNNPESPQS